MSYSSRSRDRYRLAVTAVTGIAAAGVLSATGWLAGAAASNYNAEQAKGQAEQDAVAAKAAKAQARYEAKVARQQTRALQPATALHERPARTRVTTRYVTGAATTQSVGGGGTVSTPSGSSPQPAAPAGHSAPQAPPPPPPPPPAPSSGS